MTPAPRDARDLAPTERAHLGPNHKDGCTGDIQRYSGSGYNRVRLCACGAEDHAPEPWTHFADEIIRELKGKV